MNMMVSATAIAAASPAVAAAGNPDAEIIAAVEKVHQLKPIYDEAQARWDVVYAEFKRRRPEKVDALCWRPDDALNIAHFGRDQTWYCPFELNKRRDIPQVTWRYVGPEVMPAGYWDDEEACPKEEFLHLFEARPDERKQRRLNEAVAALDVHTAACDAIKAELGLHQIEDHLNDVYFKQVLPLQEMVIKTKAHTLAGVRAKAQMMVEWFFEDCDEEEVEEMCEYDRLLTDIVEGVAALAV